MKIKYTKWIVALTMTAMGVGMAAFSFNSPNVQLPEASQQETEALNADEEFGAVQRSGFSLLPQLGASLDSTPSVVSVEPEAVVDPLEVPLETVGYDEIDTLMESYLSAKLTCDMDEFEELVTDTSYIELDKLQRKTEYIEEYENTECYVKPAEGDIDYIVYVYHEMKITSIDTLAPALDEFYVTCDETGSPRVVLGEISDETLSYIEEARATQEVQDLISDVSDRLESALEEDEALAEFYTKLSSPAVPKE